MMRRAMAVSLVTMSMALSGCQQIEDMFSDKDWREGVESKADCVARLNKQLGIRQVIEPRPGEFEPLFLYDITKMDLDTINAMIVPHKEDGERGSLRTSEFGAQGPVRQGFMDLDVDEDGAFLFGDDPSLYRVPGTVGPVTAFLEEGCAGQKADMRLIEIDMRNQSAPAPEEDEGESNEEQ